MSARKKVCKLGSTWCTRHYWGTSNWCGAGPIPDDARLAREARAEELWEAGRQEEAWNTDQRVAAILNARDTDHAELKEMGLA